MSFFEEIKLTTETGQIHSQKRTTWQNVMTSKIIDIIKEDIRSAAQKGDCDIDYIPTARCGDVIGIHDIYDYSFANSHRYLEYKVSDKYGSSVNEIVKDVYSLSYPTPYARNYVPIEDQDIISQKIAQYFISEGFKDVDIQFIEAKKGIIFKRNIGYRELHIRISW